MPKRSAEEKLLHYRRKIKKLEEKQGRMSRRIRSDSENSTEDLLISGIPPVLEPEVECDPGTEAEPGFEAEPELEAEPQFRLEPASTEPINITQTLTSLPEVIGQENVTPTVPVLNPDILAALGEITDDSPEFGAKIHENLAKIWMPLLKKGLTKESRERLLKEYLIPENCPLLKAPTLNPEISAAIPESGRSRDKKLLTYQQQLGVGITAINRGLDILLTGDNKIDALKFICDGNRILSDLHFQKTESRIKFISPGLDKTFLQLIETSERDQTLFGITLPDRIKASKAIASQSQQIKKSTTAPKQSSSQAANRGTKPENWQGPPRFPSNRGSRGGSKRTNRHYYQPAHTSRNTMKTRGAPRQ